MTPRILALDTTTASGSLALAEASHLRDEVVLHSPDGFGHILHRELTSLLERNGWKLEEIDCFAAASGPGSFTGVRVGLAAVKGLAASLDKPAVAVSNLQALASFGAAPLRAAVVDARRGEIYGAVYNAELEIVSPETVLRFEEWLKTLPEGEIEFISADFTPYRQALDGTRFERARVCPAPRALASAVARIAALRLAAGAAPDPAGIDANYVRRSDAELFWKDC